MKISQLEEMPYNEEYIEKLYSLHWHEVLEYVTLQEALYWAAYRCDIPESDEEDVRFCNNDIFEMGARYSYKIGRKTSYVDYPNRPLDVPMWATETYEMALKSPHLTSARKDEITLEYHRNKEDRKIHEQKYAIWKNTIESQLEPFKHELFLLLRKGKIQGYGNIDRVLSPSERALGKKLEDIPGAEVFSVKDATPIPTDFWAFNSIFWEENAAESQNTSYVSIYILPEELFKHFPEPKSRSEIQVIFNGKVLRKGGVLEKRGSKAQYPWEDFHAELARRILEAGGLPKIQSQLVNEMLLWCSDNWRGEPAESVVKEKIRPYYKIIPTY